MKTVKWVVAFVLTIGFFSTAQATPLGSLVFNEPTGTIGPNDVVNVSLKFTLDANSEVFDKNDLTNIGLPAGWASVTSVLLSVAYGCSDTFSGGCGLAPSGHPYYAEFYGSSEGYTKVQDIALFSPGDSIDFFVLSFTPNGAPVPDGTYSLYSMFVTEVVYGTQFQEQFDQNGDLIVDQDGNPILAEVVVSESRDVAVTCPDFNGQGCSGNQIFTRTVSSVPEPEAYAMWLAGLGFMGFINRRRLA